MRMKLRPTRHVFQTNGTRALLVPTGVFLRGIRKALRAEESRPNDGAPTPDAGEEPRRLSHGWRQNTSTYVAARDGTPATLGRSRALISASLRTHRVRRWISHDPICLPLRTCVAEPVCGVARAFIHVWSWVGNGPKGGRNAQ